MVFLKSDACDAYAAFRLKLLLAIELSGSGDLARKTILDAALLKFFMCTICAGLSMNGLIDSLFSLF